MNKEQLSNLKGLVNNSQQWNNFSNYIETLVEDQRRTMEQTDELKIMYRAQGAIYQLRRLQKLRDEVLKSG
jgi:hypothetical protein